MDRRRRNSDNEMLNGLYPLAIGFIVLDLLAANGSHRRMLITRIRARNVLSVISKSVGCAGDLFMVVVSAHLIIVYKQHMHWQSWKAGRYVSAATL
jgi:hypothetical protein